MTIPPEVVSHLDIEQGDIIALQVEHSDDNGRYSSFWNQTKQGDDE
jgi:hypothetical protein